MRIVLLGPSIWSEIAVAVALQLTRAGHRPVGAVTLPTLHGSTILRKAMQWGPRDFARYATGRVLGRSARSARSSLRNRFLGELTESDGVPLRNLEVAARHLGFPLASTRNLNSADCLERIAAWQADAIVYTGGGILRRPILQATRIGVINIHAGLLPEVRGMSCPEWSLLDGIPLGTTVHLMDTGIDTGPILLRRELPKEDTPDTIRAVRDRLGLLGVEMVVEAVHGLADGTLVPQPQERIDEDLQRFVMHQRLAAAAQRRLDAYLDPAPAFAHHVAHAGS